MVQGRIRHIVDPPQPLDEKETEEGRIRNRRVEFHIGASPTALPAVGGPPAGISEEK